MSEEWLTIYEGCNITLEMALSLIYVEAMRTYELHFGIDSDKKIEVFDTGKRFKGKRVWKKIPIT